jgi:hypothetical protein
MLTQREFAGRAVVMGLLILIAGFVVVGSLMGAVVERSAAAVGCSAVIALVCFSFAVKVWHGAPEEEGADLFSGRKGLLLTLLIVYVLTFAGMALWVLTSPDAWRGFLEGWGR